MELRDAIRQNRMTGFQWKVVITCILLTIIDGYEILIPSFVLPTLKGVWNLTPGQMGLVASIGTLGMGVGAAVLGPLADKIGRRKHIIGSMIFIVIFMTLSGLSPNFTMFLIWRFIAGLGLGGIVPSINALVAEYANDAKRGSIMAFYGIGFPLGSGLGGFLSIWLIKQWSWHGPFLFSAIVTALLTVWCIFALPESVSYLVEKRPKGAIEQYNKISQAVGLGADQTLPEPTSHELKPSLRKDMWSGLMLKRTVLLWIAYALLIASFYFINSFVATFLSPSLKKPVAEGGLGPEQGAATALAVQATISVGGVIGALLIAALALRWHPRLVTFGIMIWGFISYWLFAQFFDNVGMLFVLALGVGMAANGGVTAYYAISPPIYPTAIRASAVGLMMGFGRGVAFLAPNIGAAFIAAGVSNENNIRIFGAIMLLSAVFVLLLHRTYRGEHSKDAMETETAVAAKMDHVAESQGR